MGIVKRQGIQSAIIIYAGFALGAINLLVLFPKYFTPEQIGLTRVLFDCSSIFVQLALMGVPSMMLKFFPYYNDNLSKKENDFLFLSLLISAIGFALFVIIMWVFEDKIKAIYAQRSPLFVDFFYLIYVFSFFILIYTVFETYARNNLKTVIGSFVREIGFRIYTSILILLFAFKFIDFPFFIKTYSSYYVVGILLIVFYLLWQKRFYIHTSISKVTKKFYKKIVTYGTFIYGGGLLLVIAGNIDVLFIAGIKGLESTAVFTIAAYIATIIQVPQRSTTGIIVPLLSKAWKDKNIELIDSLYKKTAINQMVLGIFLFLIIWVNVDSVFQLMPNGSIYQQGKYVILIMCLTKLIDMGTGVNSEILVTSSFWRFNFWAHVVLVALSIPTNYFLITKYGIIGSAYSNLIAFTIYNLMRFIFLLWKFNLQPFSYKTFFCIIIGVASYYIVSQIPYIENTYYSIAIKMISISVIYFISIILFKISDDIQVFYKRIKDGILLKKI